MLRADPSCTVSQTQRPTVLHVSEMYSCLGSFPHSVFSDPNQREIKGQQRAGGRGKEERVRRNLSINFTILSASSLLSLGKVENPNPILESDQETAKAEWRKLIYGTGLGSGCECASGGGRAIHHSSLGEQRGPAPRSTAWAPRPGPACPTLCQGSCSPGEGVRPGSFRTLALPSSPLLPPLLLCLQPL